MRCGKGGPRLLKLALSLTFLAVLLVGGMALSTEASQLARIDVVPFELSIELSGQQQFIAKGYDAEGNEISITPGWSATGGTITTDGRYTAGDRPGIFIVIASVSGSDVRGYGTAWVGVPPQILVRIVVSSSSAILNAGQSQQFDAEAYDIQENPVTINPIWNATGGAITSEGRHTAGDRPGIFLVTASVSGSSVRGHATAWVVIRPQIVSRIVVSPSTAILNAGQTLQFSVEAFDSQGNLTSISPIWNATDGEIGLNGLYLATAVGNFTVTASVQGSTVTGMSTVQVDPPRLVSIGVTLPAVTMNLGDQQQFQARGYDAQGKEIEITPIWNATDGEIGPNGLYMATAAGNFTVTASVQGSTVTGTSTVQVGPPM